MPNLKDLRIRINSVKATQKITKAMQMVAASKLRRAQDQAVAARPYAERMEEVVASLAASLGEREGAPPLLVGTGRDETRLIIVASSNRGLCGGFNTSIVRGAVQLITAAADAGKTVRILCVGRKGRDQLKRVHGGKIVDTIEGLGAKGLDFGDAEMVANRILAMYAAGEFDTCTIIYNHFHSVMRQEVTVRQLIPFTPSGDAAAGANEGADYEFEPDEEEILAELMPRNLGVQVFRALLENAASEQGARMTAMDSATRNAGDMIDQLTLNYNRTRQAVITREMIEIVSGAEAI